MNSEFSESSPLRIAIVGSGPSGFYAIDALLKKDIPVEISMFERLPAPYGLVRSGVAPDHPKLKKAIKVYTSLAQSPVFTYFGNVTVGSDISIDELKAAYHAVVLSCGAETDRKLGISGEDLPGSHTATEFVGWYNGHPDYRDREFDLSHETAVVIGQGNVAADVSRILAKTLDELKNTDIAQHALEVLAESRIRDIYVIGRRGPAQAKFTSKELKEFGELADCTPVVDPEELVLNPASITELEDKDNANNKKVYELFRSFAESPPGNRSRRVHFTFCKSPIEITGESRVEKLKLEINRLSGEPFNQSAEGGGEFVELDCGILFRSIGYRGVPVAGVPFDEKRGVIPSLDGRVIEGDSPVDQLYVSGWIKRGATGIIGTNKPDSVATIASLLEDLEKFEAMGQRSGAEEALRLLNERGIRYVSFTDWEKIDRAEVERGQPRNKPREKYTRIEEMLALLD